MSVVGNRTMGIGRIKYVVDFNSLIGVKEILKYLIQFELLNFGGSEASNTIK